MTTRWRPGSVKDDTELVERPAQLGCIAIDTESARSRELVLSVAPAQHTDAEHAGAPSGEDIPDGVADDVAVLHFDPETLLAGEEEIGRRLRAGNVASIDDDRLRPDAQRFQ
jgi:hypothetical protein